MALLLMHETAHTFGLGDSFNEEDVVPLHDASGMQCVMEAYQEGSAASNLYSNITTNNANAFCEVCKNNLISAMS